MPWVAGAVIGGVLVGAMLRAVTRDGRELFYRLGSQMWAVAVNPTPEFSIGRATLLFDDNYDLDPNSSSVGVPNYDVPLDGQQFLMVRSSTGALVPITLVQNWFEELKRLVPTS